MLSAHKQLYLPPLFCNFIDSSSLHWVRCQSFTRNDAVCYSFNWSGKVSVASNKLTSIMISDLIHNSIHTSYMCMCVYIYDVFSRQLLFGDCSILIHSLHYDTYGGILYISFLISFAPLINLFIVIKNTENRK